MNSIKLLYKMDTIFMKSGNSKHLTLIDYCLILQIKKNLKMSDKCVALSTVSIYYTWKNIKRLYKNNKFKISA